MKNKLKFKKASLNATDLMKGEDGGWSKSIILKFFVLFCLFVVVFVYGLLLVCSSSL